MVHAGCYSGKHSIAFAAVWVMVGEGSGRSERPVDRKGETGRDAAEILLGATGGVAGRWLYVCMVCRVFF